MHWNFRRLVCVSTLYGCFTACSESQPGSSSSKELDAAITYDAALSTSRPSSRDAGDGSAGEHGAHIFDPTRVASLAIEVAQSDLQTLRADADQPMGFEDFTYVPARIIYDGVVLQDVGVRVKGNSSRASAIGNAVPFKLDTNRYIAGLELDGETKLNLHNNVNQPALMNEFLSYAALREHGVAASRTGWVDVTLNGEFLGTYTVVEQVAEKLLERYYADGEADLYKPEPPSGYLTYSGDDFASYATANYEAKNDTNHTTFLALVKSINQAEVDAWKAVIDVDSVLDYFATNVALGNWDTYVAMGHNYYLFEATPGRMVMLPWDMNLSQASGSAVCPRDAQQGGLGGAPPDGLPGAFPVDGGLPGVFPGGGQPPELIDGGFMLPPELADAGLINGGGVGQGGDAPLHDRLLANPEYLERYLARLTAFLQGAGSVASLHQNIQVGRLALGGRVTDQAVQDLRDAVSQRVASLLLAIPVTTQCNTVANGIPNVPGQ